MDHVATLSHVLTGGLRREAVLLKKMHHPGIVQCTDVVDDGRQLVLILEWLRGGPLLDQMHRIAGDTYTEQQAAVIFSQVPPSSYLLFLHLKRIPSCACWMCHCRIL